jgi:hypothetical protein
MVVVRCSCVLSRCLLYTWGGRTGTGGLQSQHTDPGRLLFKRLGKHAEGEPHGQILRSLALLWILACRGL